MAYTNPYTKTPWSNGSTAVSANNMNHIEDGIYDAHEALENVYMKSEITISTTAAPSTGTPNTFYIQII